MGENLRPGLNGIVTVSSSHLSNRSLPKCENLRPGLNGIVTPSNALSLSQAFAMWKSETGFKRDCDKFFGGAANPRSFTSENLRPGLNGIVTFTQRIASFPSKQWKSETGFKRDCDIFTFLEIRDDTAVCENLRPGLNGIVTAWFHRSCLR